MKIKLNFLELKEQSFEFLVYARPVEEGKEQPAKLSSEKCKFVRFNVDGQKKLYEITLEESDEFSLKTLLSTEHPYEALWYLSQVLKNTNLFDRIDGFEKNKLKLFKIIYPYNAGNQELSIQPEFLESERKLGFLINFNFNKAENYNISKEIQRLAFSLQNGQPNNFKNKAINDFVKHDCKQFLERLFNIVDFPVNYLWTEKSFSLLERCFYSNGKIEKLSGYELLKSSSYKNKNADKKNFYFLYEKSNHNFAQQIYSALSGKTFSESFSGMQKFFNMSLSKENVQSLELQNISSDQIKEIENKILKNDKDAFLVVCMQGREKKESEKFYVELKILCLKYNCGSQFLYSDKLNNTNTLKFGISNIGLQIFCKSNGVPWSVTNRTSDNDSIIIGIGTSHKKIDDRKSVFYAFALCTDSSGVFNSSMTLANTNNKSDYFSEIKENLKNLSQFDGIKNYRQIIFHFTTNISRNDMRIISDIIKDVFDNSIKLVIIKLNKSNKYIGFSERNDMVVEKGTCIKLSDKKYLLWTDGHCGESIFKNRPTKPIDVEILFNPDKITVKNLLSDIFKLSSANWHGFKSTSLPITLIYSKDIANFTHYFYKYGLSENLKDISYSRTASPWFL